MGRNFLPQRSSTVNRPCVWSRLFRRINRELGGSELLWLSPRKPLFTVLTARHVYHLLRPRILHTPVFTTAPHGTTNDTGPQCLETTPATTSASTRISAQGSQTKTWQFFDQDTNLFTAKGEPSSGCLQEAKKRRVSGSLNASLTRETV